MDYKTVKASENGKKSGILPYIVGAGIGLYALFNAFTGVYADTPKNLGKVEQKAKTTISDSIPFYDYSDLAHKDTKTGAYTVKIAKDVYVTPMQIVNGRVFPNIVAAHYANKKGTLTDTSFNDYVAKKRAEGCTLCVKEAEEFREINPGIFNKRTRTPKDLGKVLNAQAAQKAAQNASAYKPYSKEVAALGETIAQIESKIAQTDTAIAEAKRKSETANKNLQSIIKEYDKKNAAKIKSDFDKGLETILNYTFWVDAMDTNITGDSHTEAVSNSVATNIFEGTLALIGWIAYHDFQAGQQRNQPAPGVGIGDGGGDN